MNLIKQGRTESRTVERRAFNSLALQLRALAATATLLGIVGCEVGPDYHPPTMATPAKWAESVTLSTSKLSTRPSQPVPGGSPPEKWWESFADPELQSLIDRAIAANLDLQQASAHVREARAMRGIAASSLGPTANLDGSYSHNLQSANGPLGGFRPREYDLYQTGFDAAWEIDIFGGVRRGVEAADADVEAAAEQRRAVLIAVEAEVARDYVDLCFVRRRIQIAEDNLALETRTLDLTRQRLAAGVATDLDVSRASAQVSSTASTLPSLQTQSRSLTHSLAVLLALNPDALTAELEGNCQNLVIPPTVPLGLPSELLRRRPDVRQAERQLAAATARVGVAVADLFPRFSLTGEFGFQSEKARSTFDWPSRMFGVGPALSWPVWDWGRLRSAVDVQNARQDAALSSYHKAVLSALADVEDALVAYSNEQYRQHSLDETVNSDRKAVDTAQQLYKQGVTDFLSVLDAERSLAQAQDAFALSDDAIADDLIALYKALGGGWSIADSGQSKK